MPNVPFLGQRARAEQAAVAHARLQALLGGSDDPTDWAPPATTETSPPDTSHTFDRLQLSPAALLGVIAVLTIALSLAILFAWRARARVSGDGLAPPQPPQPGAASSLAPSGSVVVDVAGKVRHPGLVTLPAGARVADALRAAGGTRPGIDLTGLNLARKLIDGEQIVVGVEGAAPGTTSGAPGPTNPIDLNTATVDQLDELPGVGPVLAQRIVDWRTAHNGFTAVAQLRQVTGIGDSKYADLQPLVRV